MCCPMYVFSFVFLIGKFTQEKGGHYFKKKKKRSCPNITIVCTTTPGMHWSLSGPGETPLEYQEQSRYSIGRELVEIGGFVLADTTTV